MKTLFIRKNILLVIVLLSAHCASAYGSNLTYTPTHPSFGGSPLNGSLLLNLANIQNAYDNASLDDSRDSILRFQDRLESAILSQIAREISASVFGEDGGFGEGGIFETGNFVIEIITTNPDSIVIEITDITTGESTIIEIPVFG